MVRSGVGLTVTYFGVPLPELSMPSKCRSDRLGWNFRDS